MPNRLITPRGELSVAWCWFPAREESPTGHWVRADAYCLGRVLARDVGGHLLSGLGCDSLRWSHERSQLPTSPHLWALIIRSLSPIRNVAIRLWDSRSCPFRSSDHSVNSCWLRSSERKLRSVFSGVPLHVFPTRVVWVRRQISRVWLFPTQPRPC